jgi:hypothetical protein
MLRKRFGPMSLKRLVARICTCLMAVYVPFAIAAFISDLMTNSDEYAAIMLSAHAVTDYDYWAPPLAFLGSYPAWTLYFNSKGLKTDYFFAATTQDFLKVLENQKYQSIVLVGHGSYNSWRATDDSIENDTIKAMDGRFKKKRGEWFQLTCPVQDYSAVQLGQLVMSHGRSYYYNGQGAGFYDFVTDALTAFWHIKREARKREQIDTDSQRNRGQISTFDIYGFWSAG